MYKIVNSFVFVLVVFISQINAQEGWKGILPFLTTKDEVEAKLGKPGKNGFYELNEGRVSIGYVSRNCKYKDDCHCLAPINTVLYLRISLNEPVLLKSLKLNLKEYEVTKSLQDPSLVTYANEKTGIVYEATDGIIYTINYYSSQKTCSELKQRYSKGKN